jgi:hypothetical protein
MKISKTRQRRLIALIEQQQSSHLGVAEFCRKHRIKKWTFWYWRKKLATNKKSKARRSPISKGNLPAFYPVSCTPLEKASPGESVELSYPSGIRIKFPLSFGLPELRQFILSTES